MQSIFLCDCDRIEIIIQGLLKIYQHLAASKSGPVSFDSEVHILSAENTTVYKQEFLLEHSTFYYAGHEINNEMNNDFYSVTITKKNRLHLKLPICSVLYDSAIRSERLPKPNRPVRRE